MDQVSEIAPATLEIQLEPPMSVRGFDASTFKDAIGSDATLLIFLRHLG